MNTSIVLALDTRKPKKDDTCPILLRIIHHGVPAGIRTGVYVKADDWNEEKRKIKPSYKGTESVTRLNNSLEKKKSKATDIITHLDELNTLETFSAIELRDFIEKKSSKLSFFDYGNELAEKMIKANRIGNATYYKGVLSALKTYREDKDLTFQEVTLQFLNKLEQDHIQKGNGYNGLATYMRAIRAIFNQAIKENLIEQEKYPFKSYIIKTRKTRKRAIPYNAIQKIIAFKLLPTDPLFHSRNYFLLCFFLRGMPFTDLMHLRMTDVIDGRIVFDRQKGGKPFNVKIPDIAKEILDYYMQWKTKNEFIFSVIKRESPLEQYQEVNWELHRYNKKLKKIAKACGIEENITSYVSRHSFATRAKNLVL